MGHFNSYVKLPEGRYGFDMVYCNWLVVSNMIFIFPFHIWDVILPIDELIFFKMVETTNQIWLDMVLIW
jgi:hypothetical protein